jgi:transcriptional regulator with XRE-family HTH domain
MLDVGARIRSRRKELGFTQRDICREARISKGFLSDVENGKRNLSSSHLLDISIVLDCSCDYLLKGGKDYSNAVSIPASLTRFAAKAKLSPKQALILLRVKKQFKGSSKPGWQKLFHSVREYIS